MYSVLCDWAELTLFFLLDVGKEERLLHRSEPAGAGETADDGEREKQGCRCRAKGKLDRPTYTREYTVYFHVN